MLVLCRFFLFSFFKSSTPVFTFMVCMQLIFCLDTHVIGTLDRAEMCMHGDMWVPVSVGDMLMASCRA
jgi:hypothetical protein